VVFWLYLHFCFSRANGLLECCPTGRERGDIASAPGGGQAAIGDVGEGNPRAIWRSLMRIRSAIGGLVGLGVGGKCSAQLLDRGLHGLWIQFE
jgi:hypothetical protein